MELEKDSLLRGRYRIQGTLGKGGMGAVYTAMDESLGVYVAVKENLLEDEDAIEQFRREATILAGLRHPNLPRVTDHFVVEGQGQYLVMDFIEGEDLKMRLQRLGALPEKEVVLIGIAISDALNYLHSLTPPVLHRDIKPGNIRVTPNGQVYLVDFGLAKQVEGGQMTATGARGLTPGYSPPEQYGTARTDARSDIFSLGATLYTALTGYPPEDGLAVAINQTKLTPVRDRNPKVTEEFAQVIEKALNAKSEDRYQTGAELKRALLDASDTVTRQMARGEVTVAPPPLGATVVADASAETIAPKDYAAGSFPSAGTPSAPRRNLSPLYIAGGIGAVIVIAVLAVLVVSNLLGGGTPTSEAALPTNTIAAVAATDTAEPSNTPTTEVIPTDTPTEEPLPTDTPEATEPAAPLPTATGGTGMIAFASNRTGEAQIYLYDLTTQETTQITNIPGGACQPTWSYDGTRLAFIAPCKANQQRYEGSSLFMINMDGSGMTPLKSSPIGDYDPAWSPVDNRIVFTTVRDFNRPQIWMLDIDTGETTNLSDNVTTDYQPEWAPDASRIIFASNRVTGRGSVWTMNLDGSNVVELTKDNTKTNVEPVWGPDGDLVVFTQFDPSGSGIPRIMGTNWRDGGTNSGISNFRISENIMGMREADVSPDGHWIVFSANNNAARLDIYLMRINGAELTPLILDEANDFDPDWQPVP